MQWCEKYSPNTLKEFVGNPSAVDQVLEWANNPTTPLLLIGPCGTGKTTAAITLARQFSWEVFEMNASTLRNKKTIEGVASVASTSQSVLGAKRLILFDEIDLMFRTDFGGAGAILNVLKNATCPIILTCNDLYAKSLKTISKHCTQVKFKRVHYSTITKTLTRICAAEGIEANEQDLINLAKNQSGDLKSAINDLQAITQGKTKIASEEFGVIGLRDTEQNVFSSMFGVFGATTVKDASKAFRECELDPDMFLAWVEENIPRRYEGEDIAHGFEALAKADVYRGRIRKRGAWALLKFAIMMGSSGVALSKNNEYHGYTAFQFPGFIRRLSSSKARRTIRSSLALKIGKQTHSSTKVVVQSLPLLSILFKNKELGPKLTAQFGVDEKELEFLGITPSKAKKFVAQAQKHR